MFFPIALLFAFLSSYSAIAAKPPAMLDGVGIKENLGGQVSINTTPFTDEFGKQVTLSQYMTDKPVVVILGYYECPKLCSLVFNGFTNAARSLAWSIGKEYDVIMVSIDPMETSRLALDKKWTYTKRYGRAGADKGWHFLTGEEANIRTLAQQIGFGYKYDPSIKQFAHPAVITLLTPKGVISRYLYGIDYQGKDLKGALSEASNGKIGTIVDRILLYCYQYNPETGRYSLVIMNLMKVMGALTVLTLALFLWIFWRKEFRAHLNRRKQAGKKPEGNPVKLA